MKLPSRLWSIACALLLVAPLCAQALIQAPTQVRASNPSTAPAAAAAAAAAAPSVPAAPADASGASDGNGADVPEVHRHSHAHGAGHRGESIVRIGQDSGLAAGQRADALVAVFGSASSAGDIADSIVAVFGDTHVSGPVGNSAVAVFGSVYVNSHVGDAVVAILGNVELGPQAEIDGDVVAIGGTLKRDPAAQVHGTVQSILPGSGGAFDGLRPWVRHCLLLGRPLALAPGLGFAWVLAAVCLLGYLLTALLWPQAVRRCVQTLTQRPGASMVVALLSLLLTPVLLLLLIVTVIGIAAVPFVVFALFVAGIFGRVVVLAWLGRRLFAVGEAEGPWPVVLAVLIGGVIVTALYLVPFLGFLVYHLIGLLGLGVVLYTLLLRIQESHRSSSPPPAAASAAAAEPSGVAAGPHAAGAAPEDLATLPRAGFWVRMAALLIDAVLVGIISGVLHHVLGHIMLVALAVYGAVMWKLRGATIGGIIFNVRIVRADGHPVDWSTAVVRALSCFLSLAIAGLGFIWIAVDPQKQAWHDKIAGTLAVRSTKAVSLV